MSRLERTEEQQNLLPPASPILPLYIRPALLVGVAIVERAGPEFRMNDSDLQDREIEIGWAVSNQEFSM
ncbi:hypothetical protein AJ88_34835 [Mesorhizobium amorphae CCBAU 01583]|nr:hypothetical protein AJ88_34835 [Mesorhizobium amorphae CCBAU 01583]